MTGSAKQSILSLRGAMDCVVAALLAMTAVNAGAGALTLRAHRLDIVAVGVDQERREIARAVIRPCARPAIGAASRRPSRTGSLLDRGVGGGAARNIPAGR